MQLEIQFLVHFILSSLHAFSAFLSSDKPLRACLASKEAEGYFYAVCGHFPLVLRHSSSFDYLSISLCVCAVALLRKGEQEQTRDRRRRG